LERWSIILYNCVDTEYFWRNGLLFYIIVLTQNIFGEMVYYFINCVDTEYFWRDGIFFINCVDTE